MLKKMGEPLSLNNFTRNYLRQLYMLLVDSTSLKLNDPFVQKIINKELEIASAEWHYYIFLHNREPDDSVCTKILKRFKKEQVSLLSCTKRDLDVNFFVAEHIQNLIRYQLLIHNKFNMNDFQFIVSSERYSAEKYYKEHSVLEIGYADLDIRTSQKAKIKGWYELQQVFENQYRKVYSAYEIKK